MKNRSTLSCYQSYKDSQNIFVFSLTCSVADFYSFEYKEKSLVKTDNFRFSQNWGLNRKNNTSEKFSPSYFT